MPFQFKDKKILIISPEHWGNNQVSKHHYARVLSELGAQVWFLNPSGQEWRVEKIADRLHVIHYKMSFRGIGKLPRWLGAWITRWEFNKICRFIGVTIDVLWNFESSRFFELSSIHNILKIQHIVDFTMNFYRNRGAETSDICFATTDFIQAEQLKSNPKAFKIHHGYHELHNTEDVPSIPGKNKIKAMYVGSLVYEYIDWNTLAFCVNQHPEVDFIFFGPTGASNLAPKSKQLDNPNYFQMKNLAHVFFMGPIKPTQTPSYLQQADLLLLCYNSDDYPEQLASSHKMMEYLASGKLVVATYVDEYKDKMDLLCMAKKQKEYPELLTYALNHLDELNSAENQAKRKEFTKDNSYLNQVLKIENLINQELK